MNFNFVIAVKLLCFVSLARSSPNCSSLFENGVCETFQDCVLFKNRLETFDSVDLIEIRNRILACDGQGLVCCGKKAAIAITGLPDDVNDSTALFHFGSGVDIKQHQNYKLFDNLDCGIGGSENRIAAGEDAGFLNYPWAARLGYEEQGNIKYMCGGSLVSDYFVLTAGHCLVTLGSNYKLKTVQLGEYDTSKEIDCEIDDTTFCADPVQNIQVKSFVAHPDYNKAKLRHDIGLVRLEEKAKFSQNNIKPICLPFTEETARLQEGFFVIGWGKTDKMETSAILQVARVALVSLDKCRKRYSSFNTPLPSSKRQFCAGGGIADACKGDSGSSIQATYKVGQKQKIFQYGIVSHGEASCKFFSGFPSVYTEVSSYLVWILDNVQ